MILITEPDFIPDEEKFINAFFNEGLEILHLRKPEATALQMHELISKIVQYLDNNGKLISESLVDFTKRNLRNQFSNLDDFLNKWNK